MARKVNYLNNKDILKEIHKSKLTYCNFINDEVKSYDMIVTGVSSITKKAVNEARKMRAERLAKEAQEAELLLGNKRKLDEFLTPTKDIPVTDVVFRVMTWEHIPIDDVKQKKADAKAQEEYDADEENFETEYDEPVVVKGTTKYTKVNFPPFQHYQVTEELTPVCVGKSHWKGGLEKGQFSKDHGTMTAKLAHMFIKLCERYATRSNWRGYTYNDEMRSQALLQLSQIGLQFDEAKSQNPFAYYTAAITNSFTRVLNIEKRNQNIRDDILEMNNYSPSYTRQGDWGAGGGHYEE
jgi:type II secretory pathway pseudopilin PulG